MFSVLKRISILLSSIVKLSTAITEKYIVELAFCRTRHIKMSGFRAFNLTCFKWLQLRKMQYWIKKNVVTKCRLIYVFCTSILSFFYCQMHFVIVSRNMQLCIVRCRTSRKRSCGKVMFLHLFVILFTGGLCPGGSLSRGTLSRGVSVPGVSVQGYLSRRTLSRGSLSGRPSLPCGKERAVHIPLECILVCTSIQRHAVLHC